MSQLSGGDGDIWSFEIPVVLACDTLYSISICRRYACLIAYLLVNSCACQRNDMAKFLATDTCIFHRSSKMLEKKACILGCAELGVRVVSCRLRASTNQLMVVFGASTRRPFGLS